jgi:cell shape-determining protein MreC
VVTARRLRQLRDEYLERMVEEAEERRMEAEDRQMRKDAEHRQREMDYQTAIASLISESPDLPHLHRDTVVEYLREERGMGAQDAEYAAGRLWE